MVAFHKMFEEINLKQARAALLADLLPSSYKYLMLIALPCKKVGGPFSMRRKDSNYNHG